MWATLGSVVGPPSAESGPGLSPHSTPDCGQLWDPETLKKVTHSVVSDSATPWTVAHQAPLSKEFSRQEFWRGLPFPSPEPGPALDLSEELKFAAMSASRICTAYGVAPSSPSAPWIPSLLPPPSDLGNFIPGPMLHLSL